MLTTTSAALSFQSTHEISSAQPIENIIPADFNQDGRLDLLLVSQSSEDVGGWWPHREADLSGKLHLQAHDGSLSMHSGTFSRLMAQLTLCTLVEPESTVVSGFTSHQPILADVDGDLKSELVGVGKTEPGTSLQFWKEKAGEFERYAAGTPIVKRNCAYANDAVTGRYELPLEPSSKLCRMTEPHSNAFVDIDGDCLPGKFVSTSAPADPQAPTDIVSSSCQIFSSCASQRTLSVRFRSGPTRKRRAFIMPGNGNYLLVPEPSRSRIWVRIRKDGQRRTKLTCPSI